jgi:hypothetical protein
MAGVLGLGAIEKVKFTVSVRGHQWSSARQVQETLQEFARVIQVRFCQDFFLLREGGRKGTGGWIQRFAANSCRFLSPIEADHLVP